MNNVVIFSVCTIICYVFDRFHRDVVDFTDDADYGQPIVA